jgi:hypothetical protein
MIKRIKKMFGYNMPGEESATKALNDEINNAKSEKPEAGFKDAPEINSVLEQLRDQSFNEMKERDPHKTMNGKEINKALSKIFTSDYCQTNFDPRYVDDCVEEEVLVFVLKQDQKDMFNTFVEKHKDCKYLRNPFNSGAIGSNLMFSFRDSTLGMVTTVTCNCGHKEDLTDAYNW